MLEVESVNLNLLENGKLHKTEKYEIMHDEKDPTLVLRRGTPFKISITFKNRPFNPAQDTLKLFFQTGKKRLPRFEGFLQSLQGSKLNQLKNAWSWEITGQVGKILHIKVRAPPIVPIAKWRLTIRIVGKGQSSPKVYQHPSDLFIIYNPWDKEDEVFMAEEKLLDEFVLNDVGKVFTSSPNKPKGMKWFFGQFSSSVLKVLADSLSETASDIKLLSSPTETSRLLSSIVSEMVEGNWSGDYKGGTSPTMWTGSIPIFDEYLQTKRPVKFGQCFVYSAVMTTACRAVGIPCRSVTNFVSGNGSSPSLTIDTVYDEKGEFLNDESDSLWNFHVWNDVWMARPDLPYGFGGWQAIDPTTQGGPASLEAVKRGQIDLEYSTKSVFCEVNSDRLKWRQLDDGELKLIGIDKAHIGKALLTKQPYIYDIHGDADFWDVTESYKDPEGSKAERLSYYNAMRICTADIKSTYDEDEYKPLHIDVPEDIDDVNFWMDPIDHVDGGNSFIVTINIENQSYEKIKIEAILNADTVYYTGIKAKDIKKFTCSSTTIPSESVEKIKMEVTPEEYAAKLVEFCYVRVSCVVVVRNCSYTWTDEQQFVISMPEIMIIVKNDLEMKQKGIIIFKVKNPLKIKLTDCKITYEADYVGKNITFSCRDIGPNEEAKIEYEVFPTGRGLSRISARFDSKQLKSMIGSSEFDIQ